MAKEEWIHLGIVDGDIKVSTEQVELKSLGILIGYLQVVAGLQLVKRGMDPEDVKSALWDIYDGAMATLDDNLKEVVADEDESEEKAYEC